MQSDIPHSIREEKGSIGSSYFPKNMHFSAEIEEIVEHSQSIHSKIGDMAGELVVWIELVAEYVAHTGPANNLSEKLVITKGDALEFKSNTLQPHIWKFHAHFPPGFLDPLSDADIEYVPPVATSNSSQMACGRYRLQCTLFINSD